MEIFCPKCHIKIDTEDINVGTDIAMCRKCKNLYEVSKLTRTKKAIESRPPNGSKILFQENLNKEIEITYPKKGFSIYLMPPIFFLIFWLGFVASWTLGASKASILFAMFSLPLWFIGISGIIGMLNSIYEVQKIFVDRKSLIYKRDRIIFSKKTEILLQDIITVKLKSMKSPSISTVIKTIGQTNGVNEIMSEVPSIISGHKTISFFEEANDAEKEWITLYLKNLIHTQK